MRFSEFDFDVITTPTDPPRPPLKRDEGDEAPERRRGQPETTQPPDGRTLR